MKNLRKKWVRIILSIMGGQIVLSIIKGIAGSSLNSGLYILLVIIIYLILSLIANNYKIETDPDVIGIPENKDDDKKPLLHNLLWSFALSPFDSIEDFGTALYKYNKEIDPQFAMDLNEIFLKSEKATVQYMYWGEDEDGEEDQIEEDFQIVSDNPNGFSIIDFLYKVHNKVCKHLINDDAHFFEGLIPHQDGSGVPFYFIRQGS